MNKKVTIRAAFGIVGALSGLSAAFADCVSDTALCNGTNKIGWGCSTSQGPSGPMCCSYETYQCADGRKWTWREATSFGSCSNTPGVPNSYACPEVAADPGDPTQPAND